MNQWLNLEMNDNGNWLSRYIWLAIEIGILIAVACWCGSIRRGELLFHSSYLGLFVVALCVNVINAGFDCLPFPVPVPRPIATSICLFLMLMFFAAVGWLGGRLAKGRHCLLVNTLIGFCSCLPEHLYATHVASAMARHGVMDAGYLAMFFILLMTILMSYLLNRLLRGRVKRGF